MFDVASRNFWTSSKPYLLLLVVCGLVVLITIQQNGTKLTAHQIVSLERQHNQEDPSFSQTVTAGWYAESYTAASLEMFNWSPAVAHRGTSLGIAMAPAREQESRVRLPQEPLARSWKEIESFRELKGERYPPNQWRSGHHAADFQSCAVTCTNRSAVAVYKASIRSCLCQDHFSAGSAVLSSVMKSAADSVGNRLRSRSIQVAVNYNISGLVVKRMPSCSCQDGECHDVSCSDVKCWVGPTINALARYALTSQDICPDVNAYTVTVFDDYPMTALRSQLQNKIKTELRQDIQGLGTHLLQAKFCIPESDFRGFWPLKDSHCTAYKRGGSLRLYKIVPAQLTFVPLRIKPHEDQTKILVSAYFRSGSTLTSVLFASNPDSLYMFEPLALEGIFRYRGKPHADEIPARALKDIFNCDLHSLPAGAYNTFKQTPLIGDECNFIGKSHLDCLAIFTSMCAHKKIIAVKTIRATLSVMSDLLLSFPRIKGVLVLRDPRAMASSWASIRAKPIEYFVNTIGKVCQEQMEDFQTYLELSSLYPGQFAILHYEDLVMNSTDSVRSVYRNLTLGEPPAALVESLYKLTHGEDTNNKIKATNQMFSTFRTNSITAAFNWKAKIQYRTIQKIDELCSESYKHTGYEAVTSMNSLQDPNNYHRVNKYPVTIPISFVRSPTMRRRLDNRRLDNRRLDNRRLDSKKSELSRPNFRPLQVPAAWNHPL